MSVPFQHHKLFKSFCIRIHIYIKIRFYLWHIVLIINVFAFVYNISGTLFSDFARASIHLVFIFLFLPFRVFYLSCSLLAAFTWTQFAYVSKSAYMQILHTCAKVFCTLHSHGLMEARVFLSKIGKCSLNNKHFTGFLKLTDYFREKVN